MTSVVFGCKNIITKSLSLESAVWVYLQKWRFLQSQPAVPWSCALYNQLQTFLRWLSRLGQVVRGPRVPQWPWFTLLSLSRGLWLPAPRSADLAYSWERYCAGTCQHLFAVGLSLEHLRESLGMCQVDAGEPWGAWWPLLLTGRQCLQRKGDGLRDKADLGVTSRMHLLLTGHALSQNGSHCDTVWISGQTLLTFLYSELLRTWVFKGHPELESPLLGVKNQKGSLHRIRFLSRILLSIRKQTGHHVLLRITGSEQAELDLHFDELHYHLKYSDSVTWLLWGARSHTDI